MSNIFSSSQCFNATANETGTSPAQGEAGRNTDKPRQQQARPRQLFLCGYRPAPFRLFWKRRHSRSSSKRPSVLGIAPTRPFRLKSNTRSRAQPTFVKLPRRQEVKQVVERIRSSMNEFNERVQRWVSPRQTPPMARGILPLSLFPERSSQVMLASLLTAGGIGPPSSFPAKLREDKGGGIIRGKLGENEDQLRWANLGVGWSDLSSTKWSRVHSVGGILPLSLLPSRRRWLSRPRLEETPSQFCTSS